MALRNRFQNERKMQPRSPVILLASEVAFFVHFETGFRAPKIYDPFLKINSDPCLTLRFLQVSRKMRTQGRIQCVTACYMRYNACYSAKTAHLGRVTLRKQCVTAQKSVLQLVLLCEISALQLFSLKKKKYFLF